MAVRCWWRATKRTCPESSASKSRAGRARPWNRLGRAAPTGLQGQYRILVTPDGESYAYSYTRQVNDLYLTSPF
jgi:hypothetical protein